MEISRIEMGDRFSEVVVVPIGTAKMLSLSGQVANDVTLDIEGQTREVLAIIDGLLARAGADKTHIVQARVYLASPGDYLSMNAVWDDWVPQGHTPARATLGVKLMTPGLKVAIECVAVLPSRQE